VIVLLSNVGMHMKAIRLARYYYLYSYIDKLGGSKVFVISKKYAILNGSQKWKA
jgi:transposase